MRNLRLSVAAVSVVLSAPAFAQTANVPAGMSGDVARQIQVISSEKAQRTPAQRKMDSTLIYSAREASGQPQFPNAPALSLPQLSARDTIDANGQVLIDIKTTDADATAEQIRARGGTVVSSFPNYNAVRANVPVGLLETVAAISSVRSVRPADLGYSNRIDRSIAGDERSKTIRAQLSSAFGNPNAGNAGRGPTQSQGVVAHGANIVQDTGLAGISVKICVISDGVNSLAARQAAGELPAVDVLSGQAGNGDEGTAMLELVADIAPAASLGFATGGDAAQMATNIAALAARECAIIVDDKYYYYEAAFQEDIVANAVTAFVNAGGMFFSSAGNTGRLRPASAPFSGNFSGTWEGDFANGGAAPAVLGADGGSIHSFGSVSFNNLRTRGVAISLKWSDPLDASSNDYDLYITNGAGTALTAVGNAVQSGTQDPYEFINCEGTSGAARCPDNARIYIHQTTGAAARALRLDTVRGDLAIGTSGSTYGHNGGKNTITVGAVVAPSNRKFNASDAVETYSSDGLRRLFIRPVPSTTAITPGCVLFSCNGGEVLQKPDISAADCVSTSTPGFSPFCGTSAAAPHAAGIAALIKSRALSLTGPQILARMKSTAIDIMGAGVDRDSGSGIVMADAAVLGVKPTHARDFNDDNRADIIWRNTAGDLALWFMNGPKAYLTGGFGNVSPDNWSIVGQRDFNGDGIIDLLWRGSGGNVVIWFMRGAYVVSVANLGIVPTNWFVAGTGDFNGDNKGDILWRNTTGDNAVWFMNGATVSSVASIGNVATNWFVAAIADVNETGRSDIVWRNTTGDLVIWLMNGATPTVAPVGNVATNWSIVGSGDFNGNGYDDLLWRNTNGDLVMWLMFGPQPSQVTNLGNVPMNWSVASTSDYNGDGKGDILWRNTTGDISLWTMNGASASAVNSLGNIPVSWTIQSANAN